MSFVRCARSGFHSLLHSLHHTKFTYLNKRLPIPTNGIFQNGTVNRRLFKKEGDQHRVWFEGLITTYDAEQQLYMVLYTDGDSEELDHAEIIKNWKQDYKHLDSLHALIWRNLAPTPLFLLSTATHSGLLLN